MARQAYLFSDAASDTEPPQHVDQLRAVIWNVQSPSISRVEMQLRWLMGAAANLLLLTEVKYTAAADHLLSSLEALGYQVACPSSTDAGEYATVIATRGLRSRKREFRTSVLPSRSCAVDVLVGSHSLTVLGLYSVAMGYGSEHSTRRQTYQRALLEQLSPLSEQCRGRLIVAGDLNVVPRGHWPEIPGFLDHDFEFFSAFSRLGLVNAFELLEEGPAPHTWISPAGLGMTLDYAFVSRELAPRVSRCDYDVTPRSARLSDHSAIQLRIEANQALGRRPA